LLNANFNIWGVKISHNATAKYATTMKAAWNPKFADVLKKLVFRKY
jgi:hypothetical protein